MTDSEARLAEGWAAENLIGWKCHRCDCSLINLGPEIQAAINSSGVRIRNRGCIGERTWRPADDPADLQDLLVSLLREGVPIGLVPCSGGKIQGILGAAHGEPEVSVGMALMSSIRQLATRLSMPAAD